MRLVGKIVLWLLGGLLAIAVALAIVLAVFDWNMLRSTFSEQAGSASGRNVAINGNLDVDIWSWTPRVVARDVVFGNPGWASKDDMVRIREVDLVFRVMPLLYGRLEIERLHLREPVIDLERRNGKANWDLGAQTPSEAAVEVAAPKEREDFPVLKHLRAENAILRYRDPDLQNMIEVRLDRLTIEADSFDDPVSLQAEGSYQDQPFSLEGEGGSFKAFRSTDDAYDLRLDARIGSTRFDAKGTIEEPVSLGGVSAELELKGETLAELSKLFALPLPESPPYSLSGRLTREGSRWALQDFEGQLGRSDLRGDLHVETGGERPRLVADVASRAFRIEDLEAFWAGEEKENEPAQASAAAQDHLLPNDPISLPKLRRMDAEVHFHGQSIQSGPLRLKDLSTDLRLEDGLLTLEPLELGLAEGRIVGNLRLNGRRAVPEMGGAIEVQGLDIKALLALLGLENAGAGLLRGKLKLDTRGRSIHELAANANGEGALVMSGGRLENMLLELIALDLQEAVGQWLTEEEETVPVLCLAMPTKIESGHFTAEPWILDTTDALVTITGFVDLGSERVDLSLEPHPKDFSLFNYLTSIEITGDLRTREISTNPLEAVGKVVLKTIAAPIMPLLSGSIQESAREESVPCDSLRQRLETAMAESDIDAPSAEPAQDLPISRIQSALREEGFEIAVDGILGPNTRNALRRFQRENGLRVTGRPDPQTLRELGVE